MQVSKPAVIGVGVAMVAMVGVIAFLLGRESGRHHGPAVPAPAPVAAVVGPGGAAAPVVPGLSPERTGVRVDLPPNPFPDNPAAVAPPRRPPAPLSTTPDEAAQVHEYFLRVAEIQIGGVGDPNEFANKLIASSLNGDSSGFDQLITSAKDALSRAQTLPVPAPCAAYHAQLAKMLGDSVSMLGTLKTALSSKDTGALTAILPAANALQSQTTMLESQARELKARYGL